MLQARHQPVDLHARRDNIASRQRHQGPEDDADERHARRPALPYWRLRLRPRQDGRFLFAHLRPGRDRSRIFARARRRTSPSSAAIRPSITRSPSPPAGRKEAVHTTINQISFRVPGLEELRQYYPWLVKEGVKKLDPRNHGNAWSIYFADPEGNRVELYCGIALARQPAVRRAARPHQISRRDPRQDRGDGQAGPDLPADGSVRRTDEKEDGAEAGGEGAGVTRRRTESAISRRLDPHLCHAPRRRGIQFYSPTFANLAAPRRTGSSAFADDDTSGTGKRPERRRT